MIYFETKSDISSMQGVLKLFEEIRAIEKDVREELREEGASYLSPHGMFKHIREEAAKRNDRYSELRQDFARMIPHVNQICEAHSIACHRSGRAAPMEGGLPFEGSIFDMVLNRPSDMFDLDNDVRDTVNKCLGAQKEQLSKELRQLINPIHWASRLLIFLIQLPYKLIEISGFNVEKIQDHFLGKFAQLLYVIALILFLLWLGVESIQDLISILGTGLIP